MSAVGRRMLSLIVIVVLAGSIAQAQDDLDRDRPGAKLFAANCAGCHRSPRGLAKDRWSWTLSNFLELHYTSSAATAQRLTAYLQAADAPRAKPKPPARKSRATTRSASVPAQHPPAPAR